MKNITVSIDAETYQRARARADEERTSVSRVVKQALVHYAVEGDRERLNRERDALYAAFDARFTGQTGDALYPGWRDDLYATARGQDHDPQDEAQAA